MPTHATIEIDDTEGQQVLDMLIRTFEDLTPAWKATGEFLVGSVEEVFQSGGVPNKWPELAPATIIQRMGGSQKRIFTKKGAFKAGAARKFGTIKTLIRSGRLLRSITYDARRDSVRVGTNVLYAAIHQFGGKAGRGRTVEIPARPFIVFRDKDYDAAADNIVSYIKSRAANVE